MTAIERRIAFLVIGSLLLLAWLNRFIQDDAFISFRYADNLVSGHGLVWNPGGEPVAGYSNFLWTVLMAGVIWLGIDPVWGSWGLGIALCAGTLLVTHRLGRDLFRDSRDALWVVVLLGTNYTFSAWATGGMETQLQAFLVVLTTREVFRLCGDEVVGPWRPVGISLLFAVLLLTRLDSAVVVAPLTTLALLAIWRSPPRAPAVAAAAALIVPGATVVAAWLGWMASYYGDVLPNTYYVKVATQTSVFGGLHYLYRFAAQYWLLPLGVLLMAARPSLAATALLRPSDLRLRAILVTLALWAVYLVRTGGDFMEFRFLVPVLPLLFVWLWSGVRIVVPERRVRMAAVIALVVASGLHAATFRGSRFGLESIDGIASHLREEGGAWDEVGRSLGRHFGGPDSDVTLAVGGAGAIPYYSGLRAVDMRGLTDRWVARHGHVVGNTPGHQRMAPLDYLVDANVNLVVGHPQMSHPAEPLPEFLTVEALGRLGLVDATEENVPPEARVLVVPVTESLRVTLLYLTPHHRIDEAIGTYRLEVIPLRRFLA